MLHVPDGGSNFSPRRSHIWPVTTTRCASRIRSSSLRAAWIGRPEYVLYVKPGIKGLANVRARHNGDGEGSPLRRSKG
jgi:hypothetical protein